MFRRVSPLIVVSVALGVILSACGSGSPEVAASPSPISDLNVGSTPAADRVSLRPEEQYLTTVEVVKILTPSVVQIITEIVAMGDFNQPGPGTGIGTGVILDEQGNILTNNHVIADAQRISVALSNGETLAAELVGGDVETDTAVIRIEAVGLRPAKLGNSSLLQVGEDVIAVGHALGLPGGPTVSKGVVSALGRSIDSGPQTTMVDLIQTDTAINPGNSGGPLVNTRAEVIGINTAIIQGSQGIGFAINIDQAKLVVAQLIDRGYVERGGIGIAPFTLSPGLASQLGVPVTEGVVVARVFPGTAAEKAGLQEQDVVVQMGDERIRNTGELSLFLMAHLPGETVTMVFLRGEEERTTQITLQERPR
ncbi:MAG: trypsin-like peptidase domain-containing protein [Chloroflexi bacterium]|nr:trypsin-like peptidase domain-containing protein [Chloroflexota bacterium]